MKTTDTARSTSPGHFAEGGLRVCRRDTAEGAAAGGSDEPLITVVTAVYNDASNLERTIDSVRDQSVRNIEYIVIDGGSTDGTLSVLAERDQAIDYWVSERDNGIYDAWNKAVKLARGQWIAFLGAGDWYYPDALGAYAEVAQLGARARIQYISSRVELVRRGCGRVIRTTGLPWQWPQFLHYMTVAHVGSLHHRSLFDEYGLFDATYRVTGDYEFLLRPRATLRAAFLDRVTATMMLGGVSNANVALALAEAARAKSTTGGRPSWRCSLETREAYMKAKVRALLGRG